MATLQKLRKHGALVALIIGIALALFILGDMIRSGRAIWGQRRFYIAEVNGKPITIQQYDQAVQEAMDYYKAISGKQGISDQTSISIKLQVWDQLLLQAMLNQIEEKDGIQVTPAELYNMVLGPNPAPIVRQIFINPQTGKFDPQFARQVLANLDKEPQFRKLWIYIEKNLRLQRLSQKYTALVSKALIATNFDARQVYFERSKLYDLKIAPYPYSLVPDKDITVTESEIKDYYETHKEQFYQSEETRRIIYVVFPIYPSHEDSAKIYNQIIELKPQFIKTKDPIDFVNINSDEPYKDIYYTKSQLPKPLDSLFFKVDTGYVYGPFIYEDSYTLARLLKREVRPDTVSFRHILISPRDPRIKTEARAKQVADSLYNVIKNGGNFAQLVKQYSFDKGSINNGGKYENVVEGQMVPEINEFIFTGKKGEIKVIQTQFGYHIVEILDQRHFEPKVKVAFLMLNITPSQNTYNEIYRQAALFRSACRKPSDFEKLAQEKHLLPRLASNLTKGTYVIPGLQSPRNIVHWAFNAKVGDISNVFDLGNAYVVAKLLEIKPAGYLPLKDVKDYIVNQIRNQKKGDYILQLIKRNHIPTNNLEAFAAAAKQKVVTADNISFNAFAIPGVGYEPVIFGALDLLKPNKIMGPLKGKTAVFLVDATSMTIPPTPTDAQLLPTLQNLTYALEARAMSELFDDMKRDYHIKDYRTRFF